MAPAISSAFIDLLKPSVIRLETNRAISSSSFLLILLPNAQTEPCGCLARSVPARSAEIALIVTSNRIGSSASLGSLVFILHPVEISYPPTAKCLLVFHNAIIITIQLFRWNIRESTCLELLNKLLHVGVGNALGEGHRSKVSEIAEPNCWLDNHLLGNQLVVMK